MATFHSKRKLMTLLCFSFAIFIFLLATTPCLYSAQDNGVSPQGLTTATKQKQGSTDILGATFNIISFYGKLADVFKGLLDEKDPFSQQRLERIELFITLQGEARKAFDEFARYLTLPEKDFDEWRAEELLEQLRVSLRYLLDEAHYVFNEAGARQVADAFENYEIERLTLGDIFDFKEEDELLLSQKIQNAQNSIKESFFANFNKEKDPQGYVEAIKKFNSFMLIMRDMGIHAYSQWPQYQPIESE